MPGADMGIDLGTSNTLIYLSGKGVMLNEPSMVAVNVASGEIVAMGREAQRMLGRTSDRLSVFCPMRDGVISDYDYTQQMMTAYIRRVSNNAVFNPRVVLCIPGEITEVERYAAVDAAREAGARRVCLLPEPMAAALGAGLDITAPTGCGVVDIGGGTADMAVISLGGTAVSRSCKFAGNALDQALITWLHVRQHLLIGQRMAEQAKIAIGCVRVPHSSKTFAVHGRHVVTGLPASLTLDSAQICEAYAPVVQQLIAELKQMMEDTPPELMSDLVSRGLMLTGGGALLDGMDEVISAALKVPVQRAESPLECVALGAGKALRFLDQGAEAGAGFVNPLEEA